MIRLLLILLTTTPLLAWQSSPEPLSVVQNEIQFYSTQTVGIHNPGADQYLKYLLELESYFKKPMETRQGTFPVIEFDETDSPNLYDMKAQRLIQRILAPKSSSTSPLKHSNLKIPRCQIQFKRQGSSISVSFQSQPNLGANQFLQFKHWTLHFNSMKPYSGYSLPLTFSQPVSWTKGTQYRVFIHGRVYDQNLREMNKTYDYAIAFHKDGREPIVFDVQNQKVPLGIWLK